MKKIIQFFLFLLLIFIAVFTYQKYFKSETSQKIQNKSTKVNTEKISEGANNLIKNLAYDVKFENNTRYTITADLSELIYIDNVEIVEMKKVTAKIIDKNNTSLVITGDNAIFNNSTYDTKFENNVKIEYLDHIVLSKKLDLNFTKNNVIIYDNVSYEGLEGFIKADNVIIDLITKDMQIFMNKKKEKVKVITK